MRRLKRRSKLLFLLISPLLLPSYLLWRIARATEDWGVRVRLEELFYILGKPLRAFVGFWVSWAHSRSWTKLWIASPVLIMVMVAFTVFYINVNKNRGRAYGGYYQGALKALSSQDFKEADFLFAKLIHHPSYKDNDQVLFRALIAASGNGNVTRARALRSKLIEERKFEPAKRWVAENSIRQGKMSEEEAATLATMAQTMIDEAPDASYAEHWRKTLAQIMMSKGDQAAAVAVFDGVDKLDPETRLIVAQALMAQGKSDEAASQLREMLSYIEFEDPEHEFYIREKVEGLAIMAGAETDPVLSRGYLEDAIGSVEQKRSMAADQQLFDAWLGELYLRLFQLLLKERDDISRGLAFEYFDKAISGENPPYSAGAMLNGVVDPASGYSLLSGQIMNVTVRDGGAGAHLAMAMEAWAGDDAELTKLHLSIAEAVGSSASKVVRYAARSSAQKGSTNQLDLGVFQGENRSAYQKSLDLLDLVEEVDSKQSIEILLDRCYVLSLKNSWRDIIALIEPKVESIDGPMKLRAYDWLVRAHSQLDEKKVAETYQRTMLEEARAQRNQE